MMIHIIVAKRHNTHGFFSCFVNAFTQLFACGISQRRGIDETNAGGPNEEAPKLEPIIVESPALLAPEISETERDPVSIPIKEPRLPRNIADENIASAEVL